MRVLKHTIYFGVFYYDIVFLTFRMNVPGLLANPDEGD